MDFIVLTILASISGMYEISSSHKFYYLFTSLNVRFANKYEHSKTGYRVLYKAYGLRIIVTVSGHAGKFSILRLTHAIGTGMGLFAIASIIADFVMLNFIHEKEEYKNYKEIHVALKQSNKFKFIKTFFKFKNKQVQT